ncbi:MAG: UDP-glucose 4-epimerase GalE [Clostridiales bacterium]|jgi:UDP-glucose 4-epimerase|nr:UDP-glucose 4-epimerase GalE [Clostridiales bacterium]
MAILVTGGAGYVGSHTIVELLARNEKIIVIDNLERGHQKAVLGGYLSVGDLRNDEFLENIFKKNSIEAVIHFAAYSEVEESALKLYKYYENNIFSTLKLIEKMIKYDVRKIVFSSTAAIYGNPTITPIDENSPETPINPYGETKLAVEKILKWYNIAHDMSYISLRYFNACGAHSNGKIGECHKPETHLIPLILKSILKKENKVEIFGNDYNTRDGTCIRDYVHVTDLAFAHILSLEKIRKENVASIYNLGSGCGFSVNEIIETVRKITKTNIKGEVKPRRAGDPDVLVAKCKKIEKELKWKPKYDLQKMILSAWKWHKNHPNGFED